MVDVAFDLEGSIVPGSYAFTLWNEIVRILPWLEPVETAGVIPLRGAGSEEGFLLAKRSRLVLRLPAAMAGEAMALSGHELDFGATRLKVGAAVQRSLQPFATLHANLVESAKEEEAFLEEVAARLGDMQISCKWICGKRDTLDSGGSSLSGYSLVLHDLKPEDSLLVQRSGLGGNRRFGCGIFVPFKTISGLE